MEIILKETIDTLGEEGDIVKVKPGYARNYLLPNKKAVLANKSNLSVLGQEKSSIEARKVRQRQEAEDLAKKIAGSTVVIEQRVGEKDKLYGSVTATDIATKFSALGLSVDKKSIQLTEPIRTVGEFTVPVKVGYQISADVKVQIIPLVE